MPVCLGKNGTVDRDILQSNGPAAPDGFQLPKIKDILRRVPLDTDYRVSDDIRLFLDDSFTEIKTTHMFKSSIPPTWRTPSLV